MLESFFCWLSHGEAVELVSLLQFPTDLQLSVVVSEVPHNALHPFVKGVATLHLVRQIRQVS